VNFLKRCIATFHRVNFADQASGRIYLRIERGQPIFKDGAVLDRAVQTPDTLAAIRAVGPAALTGSVPEAPRETLLTAEQALESPPTLGQWGPLI